MKTVFVSSEHKKFIKKQISTGKGIYENIAFELNSNAKKCMQNKEYSVTFHKSPAQSGDPHDYYSEGPYWWPDPKNPSGPFIRRDGEIYPGRFNDHLSSMKNLCSDVLFLTLAGYYLDKKEYLDRSIHLLKVWFIDEETKMNPNLNHGQAIQGRTKGRGIGIIDTVALISLIYSFDFLCEYPEYDKILSKLKEWFYDYTVWMNTSKCGIEERDYFNNHSNWWNAQAISYSCFTDDKEMISSCIERFKTITLPVQMDTDGSFIDELTRTRSYTYSLFNLHGLCIVAQAAYQKGVNLWDFKTPDNKGIRTALDFMLPYLINPFEWKHEQIVGETIPDQFAFQLGSVRFNDSSYQSANLIRRDGLYLIRKSGILGPLCLHEGF